MVKNVKVDKVSWIHNELIKNYDSINYRLKISYLFAKKFMSTINNREFRNIKVCIALKQIWI